jgi:hypothetical protein|tara:strand:- start:99 stop:290 length:192 start_codon:yes stop_codon:yes gene_type:complete
MLKENLKVNQLVKLQKEHQTPRCAKGGEFEVYRVVKIHRMNCRAINLGTLISHSLRIENLEQA